MTVTEKIVRVMFNIGKGIAVLFLLYFFIIAIDVLGASFQLVAGQYRAQQPVLKTVLLYVNFRLVVTTVYAKPRILVIRKIRVTMTAEASMPLRKNGMVENAKSIQCHLSFQT